MHRYAVIATLSAICVGIGVLLKFSGPKTSGATDETALH